VIKTAGEKRGSAKIPKGKILGEISLSLFVSKFEDGINIEGEPREAKPDG